MHKAEPDILTPSEVSCYLHIHLTTVYRMTRRREIPFFTVAGSYRFKRIEIDAWMRELTLSQCGQVPPPPTTSARASRRRRL